MPFGFLFISIMRFLFFSSCKMDFVNSSSLAISFAMDDEKEEDGEIEKR